MSEREKAGRDEGGFLGRWSRRKRQAQKDGEEALHEERKGEGPAETARTVEEEETAEHKANREAAEAVDLYSLTYESDFTVFTKAGVPETLRRMAMRRLWTSNPVLANLDGLNDYDEDFSDPRFNVFKSAWNVVGGYLGEDKAPDDTSRPMSASESPDDDNREADQAADNAPAPAPEDSSGEAEVGSAAEKGQETADEDASREIPRVPLRRRLKG